LDEIREMGQTFVMAVAPAVLMVELVMSIDRMIQSAQHSRTRVGEWSAETILGHVSQVDEQVWIPRINLMVAAHNSGGGIPEFAWWEPDPNETEKAFSGFSLDEVAAHAMSVRTNLLSVVRDIPAEAWTAKAKHENFGEIDVAGLLIQVLTHDEEHRASLVGS
jgi:hypothetical protein